MGEPSLFWIGYPGWKRRTNRVRGFTSHSRQEPFTRMRSKSRSNTDAGNAVRDEIELHLRHRIERENLNGFNRFLSKKKQKRQQKSKCLQIKRNFWINFKTSQMNLQNIWLFARKLCRFVSNTFIFHLVAIRRIASISLRRCWLMSIIKVSAN